jgi:hypothetical protein
MEYCKGKNLDKYLKDRNKEDSAGFYNQETNTGLIDRAQNYSIFT